MILAFIHFIIRTDILYQLRLLSIEALYFKLAALRFLYIQQLSIFAPARIKVLLLHLLHLQLMKQKNYFSVAASRQENNLFVMVHIQILNNF
jgi:hypothetical protein